MMNDLFEQRLRHALQSLPAPPAPDAIIDRVLAERAAGVRIILPMDTRRSAPRRVQTLGLLFLAAAVVIAAVLLVPKSPSRDARRTTPDSVSSIEQFFVTSGVMPASAYAQSPPAAPGAPPLVVNGSRIGARALRYRIDLVDSAGKSTPLGDGDVQIAEWGFEGVPAWRVEHVAHVMADDGQRRLEAETLFVARSDLRPLTRVVHETPYSRNSQLTIHQRFTADSVVGEMTSDGGIRRPIARRLSRTFAPYLSDALAPVALMGAALSPTWRASLSIVGWAVVPSDVSFLVTLRVVGEERLTLASGVYDCWKLRVWAGTEQRTEWVRKSDGVALRSTQDVAAQGKGRREYVLLNP